MRVKRAVELQEQARVRIADRVASGVHFKMTDAYIHTKALGEIPPSLPFYARYYLQGYLRGLMDPLWREVEFRYLVPACMAEGTEDGYLSAEDWPGYVWVNASDLTYGNDCRNPTECLHAGHYVTFRNPHAAFFWKGTNRHFTEARTTTDVERWRAAHPNDWQQADRQPPVTVPAGWDKVEA